MIKVTPVTPEQAIEAVRFAVFQYEDMSKSSKEFTTETGDRLSIVSRLHKCEKCARVQVSCHMEPQRWISVEELGVGDAWRVELSLETDDDNDESVRTFVWQCCLERVGTSRGVRGRPSGLLGLFQDLLGGGGPDL